MARRLVRHQAALVIALLALTSCSKRGCAWAASYAPEIGVGDLDPITFDVHEGSITFDLGKPADDQACPRLPDTTTVTSNGVKGEVRTFGGTRATKIGNTYCNRVETFWREAPPAHEAATKIVIDDGKTKLECTLAAGLPLRLTTPTVSVTGDRATLSVEANAPNAQLSVEQAQIGVEGDVALMHVMPDDTRAEGNRATVSVPSKWLAKPGTYRLVIDATVKTTPTCAPARKTPTPSTVHVRSTLPFTR